MRIANEKDMPFYKQSTRETCGPCCCLMLLYLYKDITKIKYMSRRQEADIYFKHRSIAFAGMPGSSMADFLSRRGLKVTLLHESPDYLYNREGYFEKTLFENILAEYRERLEFCADRVAVQTGVSITCELLRVYLDEGKQLIPQCIVPGDADGIHDRCLHWVVVYGYQGDDFWVCDSDFGKILISSEDMEVYLNSPVGRVCLVVGEK